MFAEIGSIFHFSFNANKEKAAPSGSIGVGVAHAVGKAYIELMKKFAKGGLSEDQVTLESESLLKKYYNK